MVKCNTCGGEYEPILPDGTQYFHACPPLSARELSALLEQRAIRLPPAAQRQLDAAIATDAKDPVAAGQPTRAQQLIAELAIDRPNKRDENVTGPAAKGENAPIRAEGAGITRI